MQDLERREDAVTGRRVLTEDDMSRRLTAELRAQALHRLPDVPISHLRTLETDSVTSEHVFEPAIRHDRANDDLRAQLVVAYEVTCYERKHEVAVVGAAAFVDDDHAIAIAVEREAGVGFVVDDKLLERLRRGRAAALVD